MFVSGIVAPGFAQPAPAQPPMEVTSDTTAYCLHLADRVHSLTQLAVVPPPRDVAVLSSEGRRMCENGQTRPGIMRLRQALMLLSHDDHPADH